MAFSPYLNRALHARQGQSDEPAFMRWIEDWKGRGAADDDGYDFREAFRRGIEPDLDEEQMKWNWPPLVGGAPEPLADAVQDEPEPDDEPLGRPQAAPPRGMLERIADRMSDMGYGGGEEEKRAAMRRALGAFGARLTAGALKEGTAALGPAVAEGLTSYQGGLAEQRERRDLEAKLAEQAKGEAVQQRYMTALTEQIQGKPGAAEAEARRKLQERVALVADRREVLKSLTPEQAKLMTPFLGSDKWDEYLFKVTGETPKPPEAPTTRDFEDGTTRQWDPEAKSWTVLARRPPPEKATSSADAWGSGKLITRGDETIVVYPDGQKKQLHVFEGGGADPMPQIRQMAQSLFNARVERNDGPQKASADGSPIIDSEATYRDAFNQAVKMYEQQMKAMRRPAPGSPGTAGVSPKNASADHIMNLAVQGLLQGGSEADGLAALRGLPNLYGYAPETYMKKAKELARRKGWKGR